MPWALQAIVPNLAHLLKGQEEICSYKTGSKKSTIKYVGSMLFFPPPQMHYLILLPNRGPFAILYYAQQHSICLPHYILNKPILNYYINGHNKLLRA